MNVLEKKIRQKKRGYAIDGGIVLGSLVTTGVIGVSWTIGPQWPLIGVFITLFGFIIIVLAKG